MKLLSVLKKDLTLLLRNRADLIVLFLMPLAFIIPISLALGAGDGYGIRRDNRMMQISVIDYDRGPRAEQLLSAIGQSLVLEKGFSLRDIQQLGLADVPECENVGRLETPTPDGTAAVTPTATSLPTSTPIPPTLAPGPTPTATHTPVPQPYTADDPSCSERVARAMLQRSGRRAALIIPPGFSADMDAGRPVEVNLLYDPSTDSINFQQIEGVVRGATLKVSIQNQVASGLTQLNDLTIYAPQDVQEAVNDPAVRAGEPFPQPAMRLEKVFPSNAEARPTPDTYQQTIPGYTVMYVFFIITALTASIRQEKYFGTFRRLMSLPVSRADLLGGKLLASILVGVMQVLVLFWVGAILFQLSLGRDPLAFLLLTVALVTAAATLGLAASTTGLSGGALAAPLVIAALLGGCMFPLDLMPPFLRSLSAFVPHSWALQGYQNLIVRGQGLGEILPHVAVLLVFALVFFAIAIRRFDFEK